MPDLKVGRVFAYWRAERRTIRQGLVALVVASLGNLVAGIALGKITGTLESLPGLLVLLPAAIATRGSIFGALGSRLGTSIRSGLFEATRSPAGPLYQNVYAATVLTFGVSLALGVLAKVFAVGFGVESISVGDLVVISILGGVLSSIAVGGLTAVLAVLSHRRDWDLDSVAAPVVTAVGDIVTIPSLFVATFAVGRSYVTPALGGALTLLALGVTVRGWLTELPAARRAIRESLPVLCVGSAPPLLAGLAIEARLEQFVAFPVFLVLIPPLLADAGALGAMLSSRLASKLHLGVLRPTGLPQGLALLDTSIVLLFAVWLFGLVGVSSAAVAAAAGLASPGILVVLGVSLLAGLMATLAAVAIGYYAAVLSYRVGLDPDNHGVPVITSVLDLVGIVSLVGALVVFGVA